MSDFFDASWTDEDTEFFFKFIGLYILNFQTLENSIQNCIILCRGFSNHEKTFDLLSRMKNYQKIDEIERLMSQNKWSARSERIPGWSEKFQEAIYLLRCIAKKRNSFVHSQYQWRFVGAGLPLIKSDLIKINGIYCPNHQEISRWLLEYKLEEIAGAMFAMNFIEVQIRHWSCEDLEDSVT